MGILILEWGLSIRGRLLFRFREKLLELEIVGVSFSNLLVGLLSIIICFVYLNFKLERYV